MSCVTRAIPRRRATASRAELTSAGDVHPATPHSSSRLTPVQSGSSREVSLVYLVGRVNQGIRREMRLRLAAWGLSVPEFTALSILRRRPRLSNAQLARRSMVTPQTMIDVLAALEARGLVHREVDPQHGRILRAELTEGGDRILDEVAPVIERIQEELLDGVSDRDHDVTVRVMSAAMERLRSGLNGDAEA